MAEYCIIVADGTRARFFTLESMPPSKTAGGPDLVEHDDLVSTEKDIPGRKIWSDKSGRNVATLGGPSPGYDDHRDRHEDEFEHRFAHHIADEAVKLAQREHAAHLILAAEKRMLGFLREALHVPSHQSFDVHEVAKDLTKLSPYTVHDHLASAGLLPARRGPAV
jgi:protein required for attachment to host cells